MLYKFLEENQKEILKLTEEKTQLSAGVRASSTELEQGLPFFFKHLLEVLALKRGLKLTPIIDAKGKPNTHDRPEEAELISAAGKHGSELFRLGYTLSHVVHAYGAMCQSITSLAMEKKHPISPMEFHELNRCLDIAIAGAVTEFQVHRNAKEANREVEQLGVFAHELRNVLSSVSIAYQLIKRGTVGFNGNTGQVIEKGLKRFDDLIGSSLTEVRLKMNLKQNEGSGYLLQILDQLLVTAETEAKMKNQLFDVSVDPSIIINGDQQLFYSALSNVVQNAIKFSKVEGTIWIRGKIVGENTEIEVEDTCGGLVDSKANLFKAFEQKNSNREGLGLGLTITERAISLLGGNVSVTNLAGKGCVFKISLPNTKKAADGTA